MSARRAAALATAFALAACGPAISSKPAPPTASAAPASSAASAGPSGDEPAIAAIWRGQCARCHALPERGTRTREDLDRAFVRHRKRVRLTDEQWTELAAFLAAPPG